MQQARQPAGLGKLRRKIWGRDRRARRVGIAASLALRNKIERPAQYSVPAACQRTPFKAFPCWEGQERMIRSSRLRLVLFRAAQATFLKSNVHDTKRQLRHILDMVQFIGECRRIGQYKRNEGRKSKRQVREQHTSNLERSNSRA